jgi:beta-lactamase class D
MHLTLPQILKKMRSGLVSLFVVAAVLNSCSPNNVDEDKSLEKYFTENKVRGCFGLYNNATNQFTFYNKKRFTDSSYLPASTFKIVNSLIGLQTGVISSDSMVIKWDSVQRKVASWNKDLTMYEAFRVSAVPYYQEVARRIGKDRMEYWMDTVNYGAGAKDTAFRISTAIDTFWLDNTLKITPDEELGLVKMLYFGQLPFFKVYQEKVKNAMLFENTTVYRLAYKTGWGQKENGDQLAWIVGWVEENNHPYFFVLNFESPDANADIPTIRMNILKGILKQLGFFQGKM